MDQDPPPSTRQAKAEYIERMSQELSRLAVAARLPVLSYLLDMAAQEAALQRTAKPFEARPMPPTDGRTPRRP